MDKDTLSQDRDEFKSCMESETKQRKASQDDLEFALLEKQWPEADRAQREEDGRPVLITNYLPAFLKQVTNDARLSRPAINVKPMGGEATKSTAEILSDIVRNIEAQSQAPAVYDTAFEFAVACGFGYFRVNVDYACDDEWDQDITLSRISNPFSVYGDYEGKEATSIDWNRAFVTDWYSKTAFERKWGKDAKASSFEDDSSGDYDEEWFKDKRIRVAERWLRDEVPATLVKLTDGTVMLADEYMRQKPNFDAQGLTVQGERETRTYKVKQRLITGTDILEENDWLGKFIPIIPMYGEEVNINGKRHFISLVRRAKDAQRMVNYWKTVSTELVALAPKAPYIGAVGQFDTDAAKWQTANRINWDHIEYDVIAGQPPPQRQPFAGVPTGALQMEMGAHDDMKTIMGLHDASLGARSNETSGKAIMARQREGDVSTYNFVDNRNRAVEHGGRIIIDLIPKVFSAERIMRCIQEDGSTYIVPVNQPVANKDEYERVMQPPQPMGPMDPGAGVQPDSGGPPEYVKLPPEEEMASMHPEQMAQLKAITKVFDLTTGKYDVVVTAGPSFTSRREEASQQMMEFIRIFPASAPLIGDLLAKNLDWPGAEQVSERLKAMLPPQAQSQVNPMVQQLQQMLQQQGQQAQQQVGQLQQQIADFQRQLGDKQAEQQRAMYDAQTKRMQEVADAAEKGLQVVPDPQTGAFVAVPYVNPQQQPVGPAPEQIIQHRELDIKHRELDLREREVLSKANALDTDTAAQKFHQIDIPAVQMQQHQDMTAAMIEALAKVAQGVQQPARRKVAKAMKQPDGSYLMESVEEPIAEAIPVDATLQ